MSVSEDRIWELIRDYFRHHTTSSLQLDSYNHLTDHTIPDIICGASFQASISSDKHVLVTFGNVYIQRPCVIDTYQREYKLYPQEARLRNLTYEATVRVDISIVTFLTATGAAVDTQSHTYLPLFKLPVMVRSKLCHLSNTRELHGESETDFGGIFPIRGKERVLIAQERINYNHVYVYSDKKSSRYVYVAEIRSIKEDADYSVLIRARMHQNVVYMTLPYIQMDIPLGIVLIALHGDMKRFRTLVLEAFADSSPDIQQRIHDVLGASLDAYSSRTYLSCIEEIGRHTVNRIQESKRVHYTEQLLENEVLPHLGVCADATYTCDFIAYMIDKLLRTEWGLRPEDDRDHSNNKRIEMTGHLIGNLVRALFKKFLKHTQQRVEKKRDLNIVSAIQRCNITTDLYRCFTTGNWGIRQSRYIRQGVSQILSRLSYNGTVSHLRRVIVPIGKESKNTQVRQLHASSYGFTCPVETPEGATVGIIKAFAMLVRISEAIPTVWVQEVIEQYATWLEIGPRSLHSTAFFLNGHWIGNIQTNAVAETIWKLRMLRRYRILDWSISIGYDTVDRVLHIHSDAGRILRPVFWVHHPEFSQRDAWIGKGWKVCEHIGLIVYVDSYEVDFEHVANDLDAIRPNTAFLDLHPSVVMGTCANLVPFPEHSQAPRNVYSSAMMKQSIGMYATNYQERFDVAAHVLHYPQKRLVTTQYSELCGMEENPSGINALVAILSYTGFNMEDSVLLNRSAIDRGMFHSTTYKTVMVDECKHETHENERIELPPRELWNSVYDYSELDASGIVNVGATVTSRHVLVGRVFYRNEEAERDTSVICSNADAGVVDKVCVTYNSQGYLHVKIRIRSVRVPEIGDKFCCYTQDHELLTTRGWVPIANVTMQDTLYTLAEDTWQIEMHRPTHVWQYSDVTELYDVCGPYVDLRVTGNHELFLRRSPRRQFERRQACDAVDDGVVECIAHAVYPGLIPADYALALQGMTERCTTNWAPILAGDVSFPENLWTMPATTCRRVLCDIFREAVAMDWAIVMSDAAVLDIPTATVADALQRLALHTGHSASITQRIDGTYRVLFDLGPRFPRARVEAVHTNGDRVYCVTVPNHLVYVRRNGKAVWCGNSMEGQKGTIGMIYSQEDMPFNGEGMTPDIILNPHAIPSRMTINMLMEQLCGKAAVLDGRIQDATAFCHSDALISTLEETLVKNGFDPLGDETFYNGMTGEPLKMRVFMGISYYQRLKHLVKDKIHARSHGNVQTLTRQPTEGRSKFGGLRFGEMERDSMIAHGCSIFLKERMLDMSDPYTVDVCTECGFVVNDPSDVCSQCNSDCIQTMHIPYASKLLFQELNAIHVKTQIE